MLIWIAVALFMAVITLLYLWASWSGLIKDFNDED